MENKLEGYHVIVEELSTECDKLKKENRALRQALVDIDNYCPGSMPEGLQQADFYLKCCNYTEERIEQVRDIIEVDEADKKEGGK